VVEVIVVDMSHRISVINAEEEIKMASTDQCKVTTHLKEETTMGVECNVTAHQDTMTEEVMVVLSMVVTMTDMVTAMDMEATEEAMVAAKVVDGTKIRTRDVVAGMAEANKFLTDGLALMMAELKEEPVMPNSQWAVMID